MTAYFKKSAASYSNWFAVLRADQVEVLVPKERVNYAGPGRLPKYIDGACYHQIDVQALSAPQKQRLKRYLSNLWKQPISVIEEWLSDSRNGIPLIASDVVIAMGLFS